MKKTRYDKERERILRRVREYNKYASEPINLYIPTAREMRQEGIKGSELRKKTMQLASITAKDIRLQYSIDDTLTKREVKEKKKKYDYYEAICKNAIKWLEDSTTLKSIGYSVAFIIAKSVKQNGYRKTALALLEVPPEELETILAEYPSDKVVEVYSNRFLAQLDIVSDEDMERMEQEWI